MRPFVALEIVWLWDKYLNVGGEVLKKKLIGIRPNDGRAFLMQMRGRV